MSNKSFKASLWFKQANGPDTLNESSSLKTTKLQNEVSLPAFNSEIEESNQINSFFIPGWSGDSLISKDVKRFKDSLNTIHRDVLRQFHSLEGINRKLKQSFYDEFLSFAEYKAINFNGLDDINAFWAELKNPLSTYREQLDQFANIYSFRVAVIYLLKVRFVSVLLDQTKQKVETKKLIYPISLLTSLFPMGSSREIQAQSLEQNIYSWYRSSEELLPIIEKFVDLAKTISITEIIKNISMRSEEILSSFDEKKYSHSLSHKNFGLFLNSLLINFPTWLNSVSDKKSSQYKVGTPGLEVISCMFDGDYIESLSLSHWLAQENNKLLKWEQILCPDFKKDDFEAGLYVKVINELQFLTFLAQIANQQGREAINFVSKVMQGHLHNRKFSTAGQKSLLFNEPSDESSTYDRVIINITNFPKSNIQHFLINKINQQSQNLKDSGLIYLLSSKKLFVPSQKDKIESLLSQYKLEGFFDLEEVKGKGEVASYVYILSKKENEIIPQVMNNKQTCFHFRMHGQLEIFQEFNYLTNSLQSFFKNNFADVPPMYHKEVNNLHLEFFQDAIVDGRMINSSSKDSGQVTHPHFFNSLLKSCHPFDFFFDIENIGESHVHNDPIFAFSQAETKSESPYVIVVDFRSKERAQIEIINRKALESKMYEYGQSLCFYFGITPKWPRMNLDLFRDYFSSPIGQQIIDLTFSSDQRKVKASLSRLLVPKFFISNESLPTHIEQALSFFKLSPETLLKQHPKFIEDRFKEISAHLVQLRNDYPLSVLSMVATFRRNITNCIEQFNITHKKSLYNFNNPMLKSPLLLSKTHPIYPQSNDIFVEFAGDHAMNMINAPMISVNTRSFKDDEDQAHCLEVFSTQGKVLSLYSDIEMVYFLEFILKNAPEISISQVLQHVQVPRLEDLKNIISSFKSMEKTLQMIDREITPMFNNSITFLINNK